MRPYWAQWRYKLDILVNSRPIYFDRYPQKIQHFPGVTVSLGYLKRNESKFISIYIWNHICICNNFHNNLPPGIHTKSNFEPKSYHHDVQIRSWSGSGRKQTLHGSKGLLAMGIYCKYTTLFHLHLYNL